MNLAYDVGAHEGGSTAHFLSLGCRVIAIEASPVLAEKLRQRFAAEIAAGRCVVLNVGVGNAAGTFPFYISPNPLWSSFSRAEAERGGACQVVHVEMMPLAEIIQRNAPVYGDPYYVKIDVEGFDLECLRSLAGAGIAPPFLSCETNARDGMEMIQLLTRMGYPRYALIDQNTYAPAAMPAPGTWAYVRWSIRQWIRMSLRRHRLVHQALVRLRGAASGTNSGGEGEHSAGPTPMEHKGGWLNGSQFGALWHAYADSGLIESSWYDIHAAR